MSRLNLESTQCPTCGESLTTKRGVRQHHSKVHSEPLKNRVCDICGSEFYDEKSRLDHCEDCKKYAKYSDMPDSLDISIEEWASYTRHKRHYIKHKEYENNRVSENKNERKNWVESNFLVDAVCERCGFGDSRAIQFHHTDNNKLDESPTQMARNMRSKETIRDEFGRGELLCANCHMIEHHTERFK